MRSLIAFTHRLVYLGVERWVRPHFWILRHVYSLSPRSPAAARVVVDPNTGIISADEYTPLKASIYYGSCQYVLILMSI